MNNRKNRAKGGFFEMIIKSGESGKTDTEKRENINPLYQEWRRSQVLQTLGWLRDCIHVWKFIKLNA